MRYCFVNHREATDSDQLCVLNKALPLAAARLLKMRRLYTLPDLMTPRRIAYTKKGYRPAPS